MVFLIEVISQICHFVCTPLKEQIPVATRGIMYSASCSPSPSVSVFLEPAEDQQCAWEAWQCLRTHASVL